jgi:hypothetical protein
MNDRVIRSLRELLVEFGVQFAVKPPFPRAEYDRLKAEGKEGSDIIKALKELSKNDPEGIEVSVSTREDSYPRLSDHQVRYIVTSYDEQAFLPGEDIHLFLHDLTEAAACGCAGCRGRLDKRFEHYQGK